MWKMIALNISSMFYLKLSACWDNRPLIIVCFSRDLNPWLYLFIYFFYY